MSITRVDIFPHCGVKIPEFIKPSLKIGGNKLQKIIDENYDTGFEYLIEELKKDKNNKVYIFPYSKIFCDANRLYKNAVVPEISYTGEHVIDVTPQVRDHLYKLVFDWQIQVLKYLESVKENAFVFHWHSMDIYGGGNSTLVEDSSKTNNLRPLGQLLCNMDSLSGVIKPYFPKREFNKVVKSRLYNKSDIPKILKVLDKALGEYSNYPINTFATDYPYILTGKRKGNPVYASMLINLTHIALGLKQNNHLAMDVRKDCISSKESQLSLLNASTKIMKMVSSGNVI